MIEIISYKKHGHPSEVLSEEANNVQNKKSISFENQPASTSSLKDEVKPTKDESLGDDRINEPKKHPDSAPNTDKQTQKTRIWTQTLVSIAAGLFLFCMGGILSITGVILPQLMDSESKDIILDRVQVSLFGSIVNLGTLVGAVVAGPASTWIGQRKSLMVSAPTGILAWLIMAFSPSYEVLLASRWISGFAAGLIQCNTHNYIVELAHPSVRSRLIAMIDLICHCGFAITPLIGSFGISWRNQALLQIPAFLVAFIILLGMHDSPRWLIMRNKQEEALKSLTFYRGKSFNVQDEMAGILARTSSKTGKMSVITQLKLMKSRAILPILLITSFMMFTLAWTGNIVSVAYSVYIMKSVSSKIDPYFSATISNGSRILGGFTYVMIADRFKRKPLLCVPLFLASLSLAIFGGIFYVKQLYDIPSIEWVHLAMLVSFSYFTALYYPTIISLRGELLPNSIRSLGTSIHFCLLSIGIFLATAVFPFMIDGLGSTYAYWVYAMLGFVLTTVIVVFIPETKGKTLEEIETLSMRKPKKKEEVVLE